MVSTQTAPRAVKSIGIRPAHQFDLPHDRAWGTIYRSNEQIKVVTFEIPSDEGVFTRVWKTRLPIRHLYGPTLGKEAQRGEPFHIAMETVRQALPRRLAHEIGRVVGKR